MRQLKRNGKDVREVAFRQRQTEWSPIDFTTKPWLNKVTLDCRRANRPATSNKRCEGNTQYCSTFSRDLSRKSRRLAVNLTTSLMNVTLMKRIIVFFGMFILNQLGYSQGFIHVKKSKVKSQFLENCEKESLNCTITETGSSLILSVRDSFVLPVDYVCYFNKKEKCIEEITKLCCDSCSEKFVRSWLEAKSINWHLIDSSNYISGMGKNLSLNIIDSHTFSVKYLRPRQYLALREKYKETKHNTRK